MEPETFVLPNIAFEREQKRRRVVVLIAGVLVIVLLAVAGYFTYKYITKVIVVPPLVDADQKVLLIHSAPPLSPVVLVNTSKKTIEQFLAVGQGTASMIDVATNGTTSAVYLLSDPYFTTSNLYKEDRAKASIGLSQLTSSQNLKYDLSYDFLSGTASYLVNGATGKSPHVTVFSPNSNAEVDLGEGTHPVILPGGFFVVYQKGIDVQVTEVATKKSHTLLTIGTSTPYAVDGENKIIAVYDAIGKQINRYSFEAVVNASYLSSEKTDEAVQALGFSKGLLLTTSAQNGESFIMRIVGQDKQAEVPYQGSSYYKLSIQHE